MDSFPSIPKGPAGIAAGIASILLGIIALAFPVPVFSLLVIFFVLFALIVSSGLLRSALTGTDEPRIQRLTLITFGIVGILLALFVFFAPYIFNVLAKDAFAFWAIIIGMGNIQHMFAREVRLERIVDALSGVILILIGALIFLAPAVLSDYLLILVLGVFAILFGILTIWFSRPIPEGEKPQNRIIYK
ncbi:MAG: hypothetical protein GYA23_05335 [Methanomicrobiales archaeon]|nr:hypothetical protein [Methanomicrobiales archaeon]